MARRGAGGTDGGAISFLVGLVMMIGGGYLLLQSIVVRPSFGLGGRLFSLGGVPITGGLVLVPLAFGVGLIFYNARNWLGWLLAVGSVIALVFGVIASIDFQFARLTAFELIMIIVLLVGGVGLFLRSLRDGVRF